MTDQLIERIKAERATQVTCVDGEYTRAMEARILADAKIIKAADELARILDAVYGENAHAAKAIAAYRAAVSEARKC